MLTKIILLTLCMCLILPFGTVHAEETKEKAPIPQEGKEIALDIDFEFANEEYTQKYNNFESLYLNGHSL